MSRTAIFASTLLAVLGCGGREVTQGTTSGITRGDSSAPDDAAADGNTSPGASVDPKALCAATGGNEILFQDTTNAQSYLVGRWVLCSGPGLVFATQQPDQAGLELTSSFDWYALTQSGTGLTRATGFQANGTWRFNQPQDLMYQPSMTATLFFGVDYSFANVTMLDSPRRMMIQFLSPLDTQASIYARVSP